jgi:hypothetical protein
MLAKAIDWGAPVQFLKDGQPWIKGDWKRLTLWQRVKRRYSLWGGSYVHPDGTIELARNRDRLLSGLPGSLRLKFSNLLFDFFISQGSAQFNLSTHNRGL